jgi:elongation factor Ts
MKMAVTAAMVKDLRERTGAGMMECKNAQADKKASRTAAEGKIALAVSEDNRQAVLVEINCETDFVAKDANFISFAQAVANNALDQGNPDVESLMSTRMDGATVEEARQALVAKIGENIQVRRMVTCSTDGVLGAYVHGGKIGVLVDLDGGDETLARDLAMHVAAMSPEYISADDVPEDVIAREKDILAAQAADSGKPAEIIEKMISGRLRKHLSSITLLGQPFVKDSDLTVEKLLSQAGASVTGFERLAVGEGIEVEETNFADEVLQQARGS